jgi:mRNA deadenylase 3'-5' endonuclease subunit Ccr4
VFIYILSHLQKPNGKELLIDFIFYTHQTLSVCPQNVLDTEEELTYIREISALPNADHPSDHLPLRCIIKWT